MFLRKDDDIRNLFRAYPLSLVLLSWLLSSFPTFRASALLHCNASIETQTEEDVGLLVQVGFDIAAFTPPAYQRGSLPRPS